ncbi:hypothetical protein B0H21DRAFT_829052 [Amylocystis lapponica]|nr:hypothetical protein B0H21DRAFT_829052 [Amylocystis lapponica]
MLLNHSIRAITQIDDSAQETLQLLNEWNLADLLAEHIPKGQRRGLYIYLHPNDVPSIDSPKAEQHVAICALFPMDENSDRDDNEKEEHPLPIPPPTAATSETLPPLVDYNSDDTEDETHIEDTPTEPALPLPPPRSAILLHPGPRHDPNIIITTSSPTPIHCSTYHVYPTARLSRKILARSIGPPHFSSYKKEVDWNTDPY